MPEKEWSRFLTEKLEEFSRSYLQKLLKEERVLMDGKGGKSQLPGPRRRAV